jgi:Xaa-Pro aminopeptidase
MYPHQAERLTQVLEREGLEALIATTPENCAYVVGFRSMTQAVYRTRQFAVFTRRGTALVVPAVDIAAIFAAAVDVDHVTCFGGFVSSYAEPLGEVEERIRSVADSRSPTPGAAVLAALDLLGARSGSVGLDEGFLTYPVWQHVTKTLAGITVVPAWSHFLGARRVKSPYEVECLERALWIAEESANMVIQMLKPGVTEREAAAAYELEVVKRGGRPYGVMIAMGQGSSVPTPFPTERQLRAGDLVRLDVGCAWNGYHSEVARTAVMGQPTPRQQTAYDAIQAGVEAGIEAMKPGVPAGRIFEAAVGAVHSAGLAQFRRGHLGHGIGLEPYERPKLQRGSETPLEVGEVLRIETPHYEHGWAGLNVKETVLVTDGGGRVLNRSRRGLVVLD